MRGKDGRLAFSKKNKKRIWKNHMEEIMNNENNWDHVTATSVVEGPIKYVNCKEIARAIKLMKPGKGSWTL